MPGRAGGLARNPKRLLAEAISSPKHFDDVHTQVLAQFVRSLATPNAVFSALIEIDNYEMPEDSLTTYRSGIRAITAEDLEQHARRLLHPDRAAIVLVGPAEALLPQLDGLGPIEVVQYSPAPEASPAADDLPTAPGENPPDDDERPAKAG